MAVKPRNMRVKRAQMQAHITKDADFAASYVDEFMPQHLPTQYYSVSDQGKREMVINGRAWAKHFGFKDAEAQFHFITLMWKIGADFFCHAGFAEIAADTGAKDMARIDAFFAVDREQAIAAIQSPDDRYWYPAENGITSGDPHV